MKSGGEETGRLVEEGEQEGGREATLVFKSPKYFNSDLPGSGSLCAEGGEQAFSHCLFVSQFEVTSQLSIHSLMREFTAGRAVNSDIFTL